MSMNHLQDQDRLEKHAEDNVLDGDAPGSEENADYKVAQDEADSLDKSNIMDERTRGAAKSGGTYVEKEEESIDEDKEGNAIQK